MGLIEIDPFKVISDLVHEKHVFEWAGLIFQMGFSGTTTFLFVCGSSLSSGVSGPRSIGLAMVSTAVVLTVLFRRSPLTKGMIAVLPSDEATKEIESNTQVINK